MSSSRFRIRRLAAVGGAVAVVAAAAACSSSGSSGSASGGNNSSTGTVTVAVVSNPLVTGQMIPLTQSVFEKENPGITVKFATYTEGDLRAAIEKDVSTHSNSFNVVMIGPYEAPLFAKNGWLVDLSKQYIASDPAYDASDLLPPVAKALSYKGDLYAAPFYGESSMLYYNKHLLAAAGVTMPAHPTWAQVAAAAAKLNQPGKVSGICLRGLAGWGDNMAALDTVINTFGGEWYNMQLAGAAQLARVQAASNFYVNLVKNYGEPGASNDSFNQLLTLYGQGKCAMWYDATVAATSHRRLSTRRSTRRPATPSRRSEKTTSSGWLWSWSLGIPQGVDDQSAAWKFVSWATSKQYDTLVAQKYGWSAVPPGSQDLAVQQPELPEGGRAVRQHHPAVDRRHRPRAPDGEPGALRRRPVRRHPAVRDPRPARSASRSPARSPARNR